MSDAMSDVPRQRGILRRVLKWLGIGVAALIGLIAVALLVTQCTARAYDAPVARLVDDLLPIISAGDAASLERFFVREALPTAPGEAEKMVAFYKKLGAHTSHLPPEFRSVRKSVGTTYSKFIDYEVDATYENGKALVSLTFVEPTDGSLALIYLFVSSDAFLN